MAEHGLAVTLTGLLPLLLWGFPEETKVPPEPKARPWLCREGKLAELPCSSAGQPPWQREQHSALLSSCGCSPSNEAFSATGDTSTAAGTSSAAFSRLPFPGVLSSLPEGTFCALLSHTAFDVGAVMEIMSVLFSETTLPLTHVVSFSCVLFKCINMYLPLPHSFLCSFVLSQEVETSKRGVNCT